MEIVLVPTYPAEIDNFSQVDSSDASYNASPGLSAGNGTDISPPPYVYGYVAAFSALILTVGVLGNLLVIQVRFFYFILEMCQLLVILNLQVRRN